MAETKPREVRQTIVGLRVNQAEKQMILGTVAASGQGNVSAYLRGLLGLPAGRAGSRSRETA